ncbi:MAG: HDOD domain-containing protein [Candidatus Riflebacteria bacterium]|nr:HDOD domain-containing protein [Candidatus Riflebacteria bacterium]
MNSQSNPFQLKKHADDILEIIVEEQITPNHKALAVLQAMTQKFPFVILTLNPKASLHPTLETIIPDLQLLGSLLIVATEPAQTPFPLYGIRTFSDIHAAKFRIRNERLIETIVKRIVSLPSFKSSTNKILRMLCNPEVTFEQIEEVTNNDQMLVNRMLKIANSSSSSNRFQMTDLKTVVKFLGIEGIRQILIQETFNTLTKVFVAQRDKMSHMRRCSILSAHVGKMIGLDLAMIGKIKAAGLMHDIGSLALSFHNSTEYAAAIRRVRNERVPVCEAEKDVFGIDHQEIGQILGKELSLPDYITIVVGTHHNLEYEKHDFISMSVMLANGFLNEQIEQISFTDYEKFMPTLAEEYAKNTPSQTDKKPYKPIETADADETDEPPEEQNQNLFTSARVCAFLKEELDNFIMATPESQGL